jgi:hypothetical protein
MQKEELLSYIRNPGKLDSETLAKILAIRKQYPFFQTAQLLVVKNMHLLGDPGFQTEIENTSAYVTDRRVLYELIYPLENTPVPETKTEKEPEPVSLPVDEAAPVTETVPVAEESAVPEDKSGLVADEPVTELDEPILQEIAEPVVEEKPEKTSLRDNISNLLSLQLEELELVDPEESELVPEIGLDIGKTYGTSHELLTIETESQAEEIPGNGETHGFTEWLSVVEHRGEDNKISSAEQVIAEPGNGKNNLIEKFIEENPRLVPRMDNNPHVDISENSVKEHDGIFTDTLAKIYVKQGYYSKAIFAYEKLILKYPEKSGYFAGQIEEIKKLINKQ